MDNNNAKSDDSLVDDGIRVSGSSSDKKISRTIKVIVGSKEVITMANDKLFKNGDVNVNYIINNDLVNALDILQNDIKRLVDEYGNNNPTKIEEYNKQYRSINAKFETDLIHANVTAIDSLKALCSPKLLKIIEENQMAGKYTQFKDLYKYVLSCQEIPEAYTEISTLWRCNIEQLKSDGKECIMQLVNNDSTSTLTMFNGLSKVIKDLKEMVLSYGEICSHNGKKLDEVDLEVTSQIIARYYSTTLAHRISRIS